MLPDDADWFANDGNEPITHDWTNAVQRATDSVGSANSDTTFPAPTGTTLSWGGGRIVLFQYNGFAAGTTLIVDGSMDYRNRALVLLGGGFYNSADRLPGETSYNGGGDMHFDFGLFNFDQVFYTADGATNADPPGGGGNYWTIKAAPDDVVLFANSGDGGKLYMRNCSAAADLYPFLVYWVSDQYPTRT